MDAQEIQAKLHEPFAPDAIGWKPQAVSKNKDKALAVAHIDARDVEDRLDKVVRINGWQDFYTPLPNGTVICTLRLRIEGEWIEKSDVGGQSDQSDVGDKTKAAFSDALKRTAVKFGVARYLYRLESQWLPWDGFKFTMTPTLPAWALPGASGSPLKSQAQNAPAKATDAKNGQATGKVGGISPQQADELKAALKRLGTSQADFLSRFGAKRFGELPAEKFQDAKALAACPMDEWKAAV